MGTLARALLLFGQTYAILFALIGAHKLRRRVGLDLYFVLVGGLVVYMWWTTRFGMDQSVHLNDFFPAPKEWANPALIQKWRRVRQIRRVVTGALEIARADKKIGSSLEAVALIRLKDPADFPVV